MKTYIAAACAAWLAILAPAHAQSNNAVVVELFTSQGCSSCPPADAILARLSGDSRVIALSLHVDYWDYLGWKDKFASPKFTARQKEYAHHARDKMVYTPQIVVQGQDRMVGSRGGDVEAAIRKQQGVTNPVNLTLGRSGTSLVIKADATSAARGPIRVQLVRFSPKEPVAIKRGENAGKTITYHNVVKSWQVLGNWDGRKPLAMTANTGGGPVAVILQEDGPGRILAAAVVK